MMIILIKFNVYSQKIVERENVIRFLVCTDNYIISHLHIALILFVFVVFRWFCHRLLQRGFHLLLKGFFLKHQAVLVTQEVWVFNVEIITVNAALKLT